MTSVGKNLKNIRKKNNITQDELAEKLSVTRQAVSNWENGKTEPDIETLTKIAQIFNISIDELVDGIPKGIKELRGKKSHLYIGIVFTVFYVISSLLMIILEKPLHDYVNSTYDVFYSAFSSLQTAARSALRRSPTTSRRSAHIGMSMFTVGFLSSFSSMSTTILYASRAKSL